MGYRSILMIVILVFGILFSLLYASAYFVSSTTPAIVMVIIPEGASIGDSGMNFEPQTIKVVIGLNNTVRWINQDTVPHWIEPDDDTDHGFIAATNTRDPVESFIQPNEYLEYTFTKAGEFGYHARPWMRGTVIVLPAG